MFTVPPTNNMQPTADTAALIHANRPERRMMRGAGAAVARELLKSIT